MNTKSLAILTLFAVCGTGFAQTKMQHRIDLLKSAVTMQETRIANLSAQLASIRNNHTLQYARLETEKGRNAANQTKVSSLLLNNTLMNTRLQNLLMNGTTMQFTGANIQITNSDFGTTTPNGLGNLILGFNEWNSNTAPKRTGSHNLVIGAENQYLGFNSVIVGERNYSGGHYQYTGGRYNDNMATYGVILNGSSNRVTSTAGVILGGLSGRVSAQRGVVGTGTSNQVVGGLQGVILTGVQNITNGTQTTIATAFNANMKQTMRSTTAATKFLDTWDHYKFFLP